MSLQVSALCRHPVKSLGEERVEQVTLTEGAPMPWDRVWAIAHGATEWNPANPKWEIPSNFLNQTHCPRMAQILVAFDETSGEMTLSHPDLGEIRLDPEAEQARLCDWIAPLAEGTTRSGPYRLCKAAGVAFTDFEDTHIAIASHASLRALEEMAGHPLELIRFRMNIWVEGGAPWEELDWVDREITIGGARLRVTARDQRCNATTASPVTGQRDVQIPALLRRRFGHMDFGVYAQVISGGLVRQGDPVHV
ncbi:MAG: MOSC domain-containing protein [Pseudomonadota bacterium]